MKKTVLMFAALVVAATVGSVMAVRHFHKPSIYAQACTQLTKAFNDPQDLKECTVNLQKNQQLAKDSGVEAQYNELLVCLTKIEDADGAIQCRNIFWLSMLAK